MIRLLEANALFIILHYAINAGADILRAEFILCPLYGNEISFRSMDGLGWVSRDSAKRIHLSGGCEAESLYLSGD